MVEPRKFPYTLDDEIERNVAAALVEDIGGGDLTASLIDPQTPGSATVIAREPGILCGRDWFARCFSRLSPHVKIDWLLADGDRVQANDLICTLTGPAQHILTGERAGLNFLQMLSGVATQTARFVDAVSGTRAEIVDTRKTLPGLRMAQKYAVFCGGGSNHRLGLFDAILIKENHIAAAGSITAAVNKAQTVAAAAGAGCRFVQVEVEDLAQLEEALLAGARMILLDNFQLPAVLRAVELTAGRALLEASGNMELDTVRAYAETGIDRISIGALTKNIKALDLSLRFTCR